MSEPAADKFMDGFPAWLAGRVEAGADVNPDAKWTSGLPVKSVDDVSKPGTAPLTRHEGEAIRDAALVFFDYEMTDVTDEKFIEFLAEDDSTFTEGASDQPPDPADPDRLPTFRVTKPLVARHVSFSNPKFRIKCFEPAPGMGARDEPTINIYYRNRNRRDVKTKVCRRLDNAAFVLEEAKLPVRSSYLYPFFTDLLPVFLDTPVKLMRWLDRWVGNHYSPS